jgi:sec-independent protein translocase protein TatA
MQPQIAGLGTPEVLIILAILILLFGASKLPELARGSGRALRIFKAETKGLMDDDDDDDTAAAKGNTHESPEQRELQSRPPSLDAESERRAAERRAAEHRGDDPV